MGNDLFKSDKDLLLDELKAKEWSIRRDILRYNRNKKKHQGFLAELNRQLEDIEGLKKEIILAGHLDDTAYYRKQVNDLVEGTTLVDKKLIWESRKARAKVKHNIQEMRTIGEEVSDEEEQEQEQEGLELPIAPTHSVVEEEKVAPTRQYKPLREVFNPFD